MGVVEEVALTIFVGKMGFKKYGENTTITFNDFTRHAVLRSELVVASHLAPALGKEVEKETAAHAL